MKWPPKTKATAKRRAAWLKMLKSMGYKNHAAAERRRHALLAQTRASLAKTGRPLYEVLEELADLHKLWSLWWKWRSNDAGGRQRRYFRRTVARIAGKSFLARLHEPPK